MLEASNEPIPYRKARTDGWPVGRGHVDAAVTRITGMSTYALTKLLEDGGLAACLCQAQVMVKLPCKCVVCDEIWAFFCYAKE